MRDIWLVRHGETEWSKAGRHTGRTDLELTPEGRAQAAALRERLAALHFDLVLSSPLRRARETAALAGYPDPELCDDLREWDYGAGEGRTSAEIQRDVPDWRIWTHGAPAVTDGPRGESKSDVQQRVLRLVTRLREAPGERALLFGHGHALRSLTAIWCGLGIEAGAHFPLQTATLSQLGYEKTTPAIVHWNV